MGTIRPSSAKFHLPAELVPEKWLELALGGVKNGLVDDPCCSDVGDSGRLDEGEGVVGNSEFLGVGGRASNA